MPGPSSSFYTLFPLSRHWHCVSLFNSTIRKSVCLKTSSRSLLYLKYLLLFSVYIYIAYKVLFFFYWLNAQVAALPTIQVICADRIKHSSLWAILRLVNVLFPTSEHPSHDRLWIFPSTELAGHTTGPGFLASERTKLCCWEVSLLHVLTSVLRAEAELNNPFKPQN